uniref:Ubiquitin-like domain-containing protein n=2 Tax=Tetraselmis sp. GSL018 TaxID=582737 RepID=A0A061R8T3_9CHLO|mmetsp:Transcript_18698/g.44691  ORF Transcript_18698/g.44691 Transcript_18698/m.44691 type:complete len:187 (+) Transcript_18698:290-850(+)
MRQIDILTVGGKRFKIKLGSDAKVSELRKLCAETAGLNMGTLKLVLKGCTLRDQDDLSGIEAGDTVLAVTAPQPPPERVASLVDSRADGDEDDEGVDWPGIMRQVPARTWCLLGVWAVGVAAASHAGHAIPFLLLSAAAAMLRNLGKRREGEASAYSIFNDFRELPGQLNAGHFERAIRRGEMVGF